MIRWSTTLVVLLLAAVAGVVSYRHALEVVTAHGESGWVAYLVPLTVDGLIYASSMVLLYAARNGHRAPLLARFTLGLGILATLAANVATGLTHGPVGAIVAAWPAVALVLAYELLMWLVRRATAAAAVPAALPFNVVEFSAWSGAGNRAAAAFQVQPGAVPGQVTASDGSRGEGGDLVDDGSEVDDGAPVEGVPGADDPLYPLALSAFLADVAGGEVPTVRTIKTQMSVGTDRARRLQSYLGRLVEVAR